MTILSQSKSVLKKQPMARWVANTLRSNLGLFGEVEIKLLRFLVDNRRLAIDVGAHTGAYTHALLKLGAPVLALEADPALASVLSRTYGRRAKIIAAAASSVAGTAKLRVSGGGSLSTIEASNPLQHAGAEIEVPMLTLDSLVSEPVGFLKIDVEGHEFDVLQGARNILLRDHPVILVEAEERHRKGAVRSVCDLLLSLDYQGLMVDHGLLSSVKGFDPIRDQAVPTGPLLDALNAGRYPGRYINNFLFVA